MYRGTSRQADGRMGDPINPRTGQELTPRKKPIKTLRGAMSELRREAEMARTQLLSPAKKSRFTGVKAREYLASFPDSPQRRPPKAKVLFLEEKTSPETEVTPADAITKFFAVTTAALEAGKGMEGGHQARTASEFNTGRTQHDVIVGRPPSTGYRTQYTPSMVNRRPGSVPPSPAGRLPYLSPPQQQQQTQVSRANTQQLQFAEVRPPAPARDLPAGLPGLRDKYGNVITAGAPPAPPKTCKHPTTRYTCS